MKVLAIAFALCVLLSGNGYAYDGRGQWKVFNDYGCNVFINKADQSMPPKMNGASLSFHKLYVQEIALIFGMASAKNYLKSGARNFFDHWTEAEMINRVISECRREHMSLLSYATVRALRL